MTDLRAKAREHIEEYPKELRIRDGDHKAQIVEWGASFAEQVVRRCAELAEQEPIMRDDASEAGNLIADSIRREFGLTEEPSKEKV